MFLRNYSYVAAQDSEIEHRPLGRVILGEPIVPLSVAGRNTGGAGGSLRPPPPAALHGEAGRRRPCNATTMACATTRPALAFGFRGRT